MIGFVGMSHLGLVTSLTAAAKGCDVIAVDPERVSPDGSLSLDVFEPGLDDLRETVRDRVRYSADVAALRNCSLVFLSLDIPTDDQGRSDLSEFERLLGRVLETITAGTTVVILSQVPPGTTRAWHQRTLQTPCVHLFYQVETLIFGRALERAAQPERFIVGCTDPSQPLPQVYADYLAAFACPVLRVVYESAELCKLAVNCFLVSSVSTTNFLAGLTASLGGNWNEVAEALRLDRRIGPHAYLTPGLGLSGGNLLRDVQSVRELAARHGTDHVLADAWLAASDYHRDRLLRQLHAQVLNTVERPTLAVWGLAYKADTASTKDSPALALIEALDTVPMKVYDPQAHLQSPAPANVRQVELALDACRGADALMVLTPWREFSAVPLQRVRARMRGNVILDPYQVIDREQASFLGFRHHTLGAASVGQEALA